MLPPTGTVIVDAVGMSTATEFPFREGTPLLTVDSFGAGSYERASGGIAVGCQDTNNNNVDFSNILLADPQNRTSVPVYCMETATVTNTPTVTPTPTNTLAPTPVPAMSVIINEVAWGGTLYSSSDEWIELYNPGLQPINLSGWRLISSDNSPDILLTGTLPVLLDFICSRSGKPPPMSLPTNSTRVIWPMKARRCACTRPPATWWITANLDGGGWNGGSGSPNYSSMERRLGYTDGLFSWITNTGILRNGLDAGNNLINGTPKSANWANSRHTNSYFYPYEYPHAAHLRLHRPSRARPPSSGILSS